MCNVPFKVMHAERSSDVCSMHTIDSTWEVMSHWWCCLSPALLMYVIFFSQFQSFLVVKRDNIFKLWCQAKHFLPFLVEIIYSPARDLHIEKRNVNKKNLNLVLTKLISQNHWMLITDVVFPNVPPEMSFLSMGSRLLFSNSARIWRWASGSSFG